MNNVICKSISKVPLDIVTIIWLLSARSLHHGAHFVRMVCDCDISVSVWQLANEREKKKHLNVHSAQTIFISNGRKMLQNQLRNWTSSKRAAAIRIKMVKRGFLNELRFITHFIISVSLIQHFLLIQVHSMRANFLRTHKEKMEMK